MKRVRQEHNTGCGVACVAAVVGGKYSEILAIARETLEWHDMQRTFYTSATELRELLAVLKVKTKKYRSVKYWSSLPECAIVGINHSARTGNWHWVVFRRDGNFEYVLDPKSKLELRTDFGRMRLLSCIPIDP